MFSKSQMKRIAVMNPDRLSRAVDILQENLKAARTALAFASNAKARLKASETSSTQILLELIKKCETALTRLNDADKRLSELPESLPVAPLPPTEF